MHWNSDEETRHYMASDLYRAMRGAARSLGEHSEWHLFRHTDPRSFAAAGMSDLKEGQTTP
jgi:hypothetical protein